MKIQRKPASVFVVLTFLAACSTGGSDWPNLSDPPPSAEDRNRTLEPSRTTDIVPGVKPQPPTRASLSGEAAPAPGTDPLPATETEATDLLDTIKKSLREETLLYRETKAKIATASDPESLQDAWFAAQLALTRLSRTASRLDGFALLESMPSVAETALSEADIIDRFVVGERQFLMESEPKPQ